MRSSRSNDYFAVTVKEPSVVGFVVLASSVQPRDFSLFRSSKQARHHLSAIVVRSSQTRKLRVWEPDIIRFKRRVLCASSMP